ncbi:hypothetical protein Asppvi_001195 [Aspergillus pseudoviridinutans]|uniref:ASST-domain-containing protein n=1 Tax=Aspergillus pseudoviridinutans TaxID=1517512 RepID=A0A9P3B3J9_9EURO|nr:uncharacterized protein Asppvi_001195 [Aspergillus pseudoviridinutans]GIJ82684.1 hypothetical protein Asppvi_001195 [Aspergillus pseudoviridinutans]
MPGRGLLRVLTGCTLLSLGAVTVVAQDRWPYMTLQTAPYEPPQIQITKSGTTDPGYLFVGPRGNRPAGTAALIYDEDGNLVYQGPEQVTANFRVQRLFNQDVITFWAGNMTDLGFGYGSVHILDNTYREIYTVTLQGDFETPDDSVPDSYIDLHESHISARNTLLVTAYNVTQQSLTSIGGTPEDYMLDSLFYEIDIATNEVVHSWSALEHADQIALTDSKQGIDDDHGTHEQPWDAYHINSVELFDQGYLISMRHYWSGYYVHSNGTVMWQLSGEPGKGDFQLDQAGAFSWQHDMRIYNETQTGMILTLFNNANTPSETVAPSTGLSYAVDLVNRTAKTLRTLGDSKDAIHSVSQGNYQQLSPSGHVVLGYGSIAKIKEFDANNKVVLTAQFGTDNEVASYRGYKCAWKATPFWAPAIVVRRVSGNSAQVFMSWNGATEYDNWAVMTADSLDSVNPTIVTTFKRTGFETSGTVRGLKTKYLQVVARRGDIPLGMSPIPYKPGAITPFNLPTTTTQPQNRIETGTELKMHLNLSSLTLTLCLSPLALALPPNPMRMTMKMTMKIRPTNQTLGHATILNTCQDPIYLWSVGSTISPQFTVPPNTTYTEPYRRDPASGGIALKLTRVQNGLYTAAPQMVFAYNLVERQIWYDLSDVFGDPFLGYPVKVEYRSVDQGEGRDEGDEGDEEKGIEWVDGVSPGGSMVRVAGAEGDLVLTVC